MAIGLSKARKSGLDRIGAPRERRTRFGELVQWEMVNGWGDQKSWRLIVLMDDATHTAVARYIPNGSAVSRFSVLGIWLRSYGRMLECCTARRNLFQTRQDPLAATGPEVGDGIRLTQVGRALQELAVTWREWSSYSANRGLEKFLKAARFRWKESVSPRESPSLREANAWLESEFLLWWHKHHATRVSPSNDAHRPLEQGHDLSAILSYVELRRVNPALTLSVGGRLYLIRDPHYATPASRQMLRGSLVRVEKHSEDGITIRYQGRPLQHQVWTGSEEALKAKIVKRPQRPPNAGGRSRWMRDFFKGKGPHLEFAIKISNSTN